MNVAFSAILAFLILAPGLLFYRARRISAEQANLTPLPPQPFSVEVAGAMLVAAVLHTVCCTAAFVLSKLWTAVPSVNANAIMMMLLGKFGPNDVNLDQAISSITEHPIAILTYSLAVVAAAILLAKFSEKPAVEKCVASCGLLPAHTAAIGDWEEFFKIKDDQAALVTAVVDMAGGSFLFAGILKHLHFNRTTLELDRLLLEDVHKRRLSYTEPEKPEFEAVWGDQFILRYCEIKTLNVVYVDQYAEPSESAPASESAQPSA